MIGPSLQISMLAVAAAEAEAEVDRVVASEHDAEVLADEAVATLAHTSISLTLLKVTELVVLVAVESRVYAALGSASRISEDGTGGVEAAATASG